jgi:hypothetical protein
MSEEVAAVGINLEVHRVLVSEMGRSVQKRIETLPEAARYPAYNAVRNLVWAGGIATLEPSQYRKGEQGFRVPATFLAMHAMEEAVTAFVLSAKVAGYGKLAKSVNVRDHYHKTTLAWLCSQMVEMVEEAKPEIAYDAERDAIILKIEEAGKKTYQVATLRLLRWRDDNGEPSRSLVEELLERHGGEEELISIVKSNGNARNKLMYASQDGFLTGPPDLVPDLVGMTKTVLGIIWAALDIADKTSERAQIVEMILRMTAELKKLAFPPTPNSECYRD